ncbi:Uncharacterised protein [Achromobacter xylosoxidans]|nr:Uncharacterised protein [Achromobacter xylosoxidans]
MHVEVIRHFLQHQRPQRHFSVFEKGLLTLDDGLGDTLYGGVALLHIAHQPAGLLQFLRHGAAVVQSGPPEQVGIDLVQAGLRHRAAVGHDAPARAPFVDEHVRHHIDRRLPVIAATRLGVQIADERAGLAQRVVGAVQRPPQAGDVVLGEPVDLPAHDIQRQSAQRRVDAGRGLQLQRQALRQIARGQAWHIQLLHQAQRRQPFAVIRRGGEIGAQGIAQARGRRAQITVLVERIDDEFGQQPVARPEPVVA